MDDLELQFKIESMWVMEHEIIREIKKQHSQKFRLSFVLGRIIRFVLPRRYSIYRLKFTAGMGYRQSINPMTR